MNVTQRRPRIKLTVSTNRLEARAWWEPADMPLASLLAGLRAQFEQAGLPWPDDSCELVQRVQVARAACSGDSSVEAIVAVGVKAGQPVEEAVQWARDFFGSSQAVEDASGRIDYRNRQSQSECQPGELLARIVRPAPGTPGRDVFGRAIPPRSPRPATVRLGRNVRLDEQTGEVFAACAGQVSFSNGQLCVEETCIIPASVGMASGNIRFAGPVRVARDIEDCAIVEAGGAIEVGAVIGQATVTSGGRIHARRGIAGKGRGKVTAAGDVQTGYISNAAVQAGGNVVVTHEIIQSAVSGRGMVQVLNGRIVGGTTVALGPIVVAEAGCESGIVTTLSAGEDFALPAELADLEAQLDAAEDEFNRLNSAVAELHRQSRQLPPQERERLTELMFKAQEAADRVRQIRHQAEQRTAASADRACGLIGIRKVAWPGVVFLIDGQSMRLDKVLHGPVRISVRPDDAGERKLIVQRDEAAAWWAAK